MSNLDPSTRDELVSAYLDGEATAAERALVEADPELMARAATLRRIADLVAAPVATDRDQRRTHVEAALAQSDTATNVTSLETRKRRLLDPRALTAAAVVVAALVALPFVFRDSDGQSDTAIGGLDDRSAALDIDDAGSPEPSSEASLGDSVASRPMAEDGDSAEPVLELGSFVDFGELAARVRSDLDDGITATNGSADASSSVTGTAPEQAERALCRGDLEATSEEPTLVGMAVVDGSTVNFVVMGGVRLIVFDAQSCTLLAQLDL